MQDLFNIERVLLLCFTLLLDTSLHERMLAVIGFELNQKR